MKQHLPRLDSDFYRGNAYVHWNLTIEDRCTGWLTSVFHRHFREILAHTTFRYGLTCPIYCLMPDHIHMVWIGIFDDSDQLKGIKYFRRQVGVPLAELGFEFQHQAYDRVLRDNERQEEAFVTLCEYIARNPERKELVPIDGYRSYEFTGCLIPGYPELCLWDDKFWDRFWRAYAFTRENGLFRKANEMTKGS